MIFMLEVGQILQYSICIIFLYFNFIFIFYRIKMLLLTCRIFMKLKRRLGGKGYQYRV